VFCHELPFQSEAIKWKVELILFKTPNNCTQAIKSNNTLTEHLNNFAPYIDFRPEDEVGFFLNPAVLEMNSLLTSLKQSKELGAWDIGKDNEICVNLRGKLSEMVELITNKKCFREA
jgi:hypothetical protein